MQQTDAAPERTVMIDDSPSGCSAAIAARVRCIGYAAQDATGRHGAAETTPHRNGHVDEAGKTDDRAHELLSGQAFIVASLVLLSPDNPVLEYVMVSMDSEHDTAGRTTGTHPAVAVVSWGLALWACYIFLGSLPYKFTQAPDTQHIFGTIGPWIGGFLGASIGDAFTNYGAYVIGSFELLTSLVLLAPALLWIVAKLAGTVPARGRAFWHAIGGVMATSVMSGAVFFHLVSPLGIEVLDNGVPDGGSLFRAAVSVLVAGIVLFFINRKALFG